MQDVSDQLVILQSNKQQLDEAGQALQNANKTYLMAQKSYHAGLSNYQHVLDLHQVVLQQQETIASLQAIKLDAYAGLMRALGGGTLDKSVTVISQP